MNTFSLRPLVRFISWQSGRLTLAQGTYFTHLGFLRNASCQSSACLFPVYSSSDLLSSPRPCDHWSIVWRERSLTGGGLISSPGRGEFWSRATQPAYALS